VNDNAVAARSWRVVNQSVGALEPVGMLLTTRSDRLCHSGAAVSFHAVVRIGLTKNGWNLAVGRNLRASYDLLPTEYGIQW
jgi:hypothetical protein